MHLFQCTFWQRVILTLAMVPVLASQALGCSAHDPRPLHGLDHAEYVVLGTIEDIEVDDYGGWKTVHVRVRETWRGPERDRWTFVKTPQAIGVPDADEIGLLVVVAANPFPSTMARTGTFYRTPETVWDLYRMPRTGAFIMDAPCPAPPYVFGFDDSAETADRFYYGQDSPPPVLTDLTTLPRRASANYIALWPLHTLDALREYVAAGEKQP